MNQATVNITGIDRKQLTGSDFFDYFTETQRAREVYQEVFANGSVADSLLTIRHVEGKLTDVLFNGSVYKDEEGKVLGVVIVARDVTEQKRIAKEFREGKEFAELSAKLADEAKSRAEIATEKAQSAVKTKQQFLSNMSHEIRTPMNTIIGFTKVLLRTELTEKQKEYLNAIELSGNALIVLINDILDLAKVDAGKMTFESTPFNLASSISAMLQLFEPKFQEKNLTLIKEYDSEIPNMLLGDSIRLHQIILNLVSNAVKFTKSGSITLSVKLISEDQEKVNIQFSVIDTGIGIDGEKIAFVFENFQQATSSSSRLYGGTGLGLAIVKQLVESQNGSISVESKIDEGSTFSFTLSFLKTKENPESEVDIITPNKKITNLSILVVEDIPLNQLLMKTLLDDFGFDSDIASNGKIAIEMLDKKEYGLVLMDLQMPEMNGFETTDHIRNVMKSKIPIMALTADVTTADLSKCKAVGMNDYIAKPVDDRLLLTKIRKLVKKNAQSQDSSKKEIGSVNKLKYCNLDYLAERTKSKPILMTEMIEIYLVQTPNLVNILNASLLNKEWKKVSSAAHKLIPSFSIVGIDKEYENMAIKVQEYASATENLEKLPHLVLQIDEICTKVCEELKKYINTNK